MDNAKPSLCGMSAQASTAIVNTTGDVANVLVERITSKPLLKVKHDLKENIKKLR